MSMASRALKIEPKKAAANKPNADIVTPGRIDESAISALAYQLWQERGFRIGADLEDWFDAENELKRGMKHSVARTV
jgi:hypothetical protein